MGGLAPRGPISPGSEIPFRSFPGSEIPSLSPPGGDIPSRSLETQGPSDHALLYFTLVQDGALPTGFQAEFEKLALAAETAAERTRKNRAHLGNMEAAVYLHELAKEKELQANKEKSVHDQFVVASTLRPRKYRARYLQSAFQGPTVRQDAEEAERARWIQTLADMLKGTDTPMGQLLSASPSNTKLLGGGRRVSTLRSRVRLLRRFFSWLALNHQQVYPSSWLQLTEYLRVKLEEPCNRGSLKNAHQAYSFLEEMAGVPADQRFTNSQLYQVVYQELLASALPGRPSKQAPRMLVSVLAALEPVVVDQDTPQYLRVFAWWLLLQAWATLRFSDHRGIRPENVELQNNRLVATLTRSKTLGSDRNLMSKRLVVDSCCFVRCSNWMRAGWEQLTSMANFPRDYLFPAPATHFHGCRKKELGYGQAFALQTRLLRTLKVDGHTLLPQVTRHFWTPHSGRTFMPSCSAALNFEKSDRDFLGGWSAQGSDRYARIAQRRITYMQRSVAEALRASQDDPLGEGETLQQYDEHLQQQGVDEESRRRSLKLLDSSGLELPDFPAQIENTTPPEAEEQVDLVLPEEDGDPVNSAPKKRKGNAIIRTETLGSNPREARARIRETLEEGFYVCLSGKRKIRTLHRLGACYLLPGVDYLEYEFQGRTVPRSTQYDCVCSLCSRQGVRDGGDSSCTMSSSSSAEEEGQQ